MVKITVYAQSFKIRYPNMGKLINDLKNFNDGFVTYKMGLEDFKGYGKKRKMLKVRNKEFVITENINNKTYLIYNITLLSRLKTYLERLHYKYTTTYIEPIEGALVDFEANPLYKPRDYQQIYIDKVLAWKQPSCLIDLFTGKGKTFIAMKIMSIISKRFAVVVLSRYIDKWIDDVTELTNITKKEILVIKSGKHLEQLTSIELETFKCVILSLNTISRRITEHLKEPNKFDETPSELIDFLELDSVIVDETHQEFFNVFRFSLFCNVRLFLGLSATLITRDRSLDRLYHTLYPEEARIKGIIEPSKHVEVFSVSFRFKDPRIINSSSQFGYSQLAYEKSIKKWSLTFHNYLKMLTKLTNQTFVNRRSDGDKLLIFMGTVDICVKTVNALRSVTNLKVTKYTEEDDYTVIEDNDIIVSTVGSSGTALDIKGLLTVIQTVNVDSIVANIQTLGRLRERDDKKVQLYYTWSPDIEAHRRYYQNRTELFTKIAKPSATLRYDEFI